MQTACTEVLRWKGAERRIWPQNREQKVSPDKTGEVDRGQIIQTLQLVFYDLKETIK